MTKLQQLLLALIDRQLVATSTTDKEMLRDFSRVILQLVEKEAVDEI